MQPYYKSTKCHQTKCKVPSGTWPRVESGRLSEGVGLLKTEGWTGWTGLGLAGWEPSHKQEAVLWDLMWERAASPRRASQLSHSNLSTPVQLKCRPWLRRPAWAWYCAAPTRPQELVMVWLRDNTEHWGPGALSRALKPRRGDENSGPWGSFHLDSKISRRQVALDPE